MRHAFLLMDVNMLLVRKKNDHRVVSSTFFKSGSLSRYTWIPSPLAINVTDWHQNSKFPSSREGRFAEMRLSVGVAAILATDS